MRILYFSSTISIFKILLLPLKTQFKRGKIIFSLNCLCLSRGLIKCQISLFPSDGQAVPILTSLPLPTYNHTQTHGETWTEKRKERRERERKNNENDMIIMWVVKKFGRCGLGLAIIFNCMVRASTAARGCHVLRYRTRLVGLSLKPFTYLPLWLSSPMWDSPEPQHHEGSVSKMTHMEDKASSLMFPFSFIFLVFSLHYRWRLRHLLLT